MIDEDTLRRSVTQAPIFADDCEVVKCRRCGHPLLIRLVRSMTPTHRRRMKCKKCGAWRNIHMPKKVQS